MFELKFWDALTREHKNSTSTDKNIYVSTRKIWL